MKKILLLFAALAITISAKAYDFPYMLFTNVDGSERVMKVDQLELTIADGQLQAVNATESQAFSLADLAKMRFASDASAVELNTLDLDAPVQVYSLTGVAIGSFPDSQKAKAALAPGIYILKQGKNVKKLAVR